MEWFIVLFGIIILIIGVILIIVASKKIIKTDEENKKVEQELNNLNAEKQKIQQDINRDKELSNMIQSSLKQMQTTATESFELYHDELEHQYQETDKEYDELLQRLEEIYNNQQEAILAEIQKQKDVLESLTATRKAAIEAQLKEEAIKAKEWFYSLSLDEMDLHEAKILHSIESELRDPRPIKMIIWSTYYSKKANDMAARVLGTGNEVTGIYKITNKLSGLCYIGQAKNIRERWREHMKCGLGIDTPASNKLYQAMLKDGIDNFTFELLETCPVQELDEKESFYINLYQAKEYGYNSTAGNRK